MNRRLPCPVCFVEGVATKEKQEPEPESFIVKEVKRIRKESRKKNQRKRKLSKQIINSAAIVHKRYRTRGARMARAYQLAFLTLILERLLTCFEIEEEGMVVYQDSLDTVQELVEVLKDLMPIVRRRLLKTKLTLEQFLEQGDQRTIIANQNILAARLKWLDKQEDKPPRKLRKKKPVKKPPKAKRGRGRPKGSKNKRKAPVKVDE